MVEPYFAYINPGAGEFSDLMISILGDLIERFTLDAVFLDQTLLAFNVSRGPNFIEGMRNHIVRLHESFPHILFAGEGIHEHVASSLPLAQIHGIDTVLEARGGDGASQWRNLHPVSAYLFGKYARFMAHLLTRHPSHPQFALQEDAYDMLGVLPALCLYESSQEIDCPAVRDMIRRAQSLPWIDG